MTLDELQTVNFEEGTTLLIDKPLDWTSFDAVRKIRNLIK
ncbi:MAG: tRNA pseudouridine(55) synthase, partial [Niabella sp.]